LDHVQNSCLGEHGLDCDWLHDFNKFLNILVSEFGAFGNKWLPLSLLDSFPALIRNHKVCAILVTWWILVPVNAAHEVRDQPLDEISEFQHPPTKVCRLKVRLQCLDEFLQVFQGTAVSALVDPTKFILIFSPCFDKPTIVDTIHWLTADKSSL
jgi:hypothetical protein